MKTLGKSAFIIVSSAGFWIVGLTSRKISSYIYKWYFKINLEWKRKKDSNFAFGYRYSSSNPWYASCLFILKIRKSFSESCWSMRHNYISNWNISIMEMIMIYGFPNININYNFIQQGRNKWAIIRCYFSHLKYVHL